MFRRLCPPLEGGRADTPDTCLSATPYAALVAPVDRAQTAPIVISMDDPAHTPGSGAAPPRFADRPASAFDPTSAWQTAVAPARSLGPITEPRFAEAFKDCALVCAKVAAKLIGVDAVTLSAMADAGIVQAVRKGRLRSYAEHALRTYLLDGPDLPEARPRERAVSVPRNRRATPFSQRSMRHR